MKSQEWYDGAQKLISETEEKIKKTGYLEPVEASPEVVAALISIIMAQQGTIKYKDAVIESWRGQGTKVGEQGGGSR